MATTEAKRVVILGAGFAGISLARELARLTKKDPAIQIHLVNQENYFVFQPMLPEVVSCAIEPCHILHPIRHLCPNINVHQATIAGIDLETRKIALVGTDSIRPRKLSYDHLVISLGLTLNLNAVPGMAQNMPFPSKPWEMPSICAITCSADWKKPTVNLTLTCERPS